MLSGMMNAVGVSIDGGVVVGGSNCGTQSFVVAHNTATRTLIWKKQLPQSISSIRAYGGIVIVPLDYGKTLVLDISTGNQIHSLPSAGKDIHSICVFEGLTDVSTFKLPFVRVHFSATDEACIEAGAPYGWYRFITWPSQYLYILEPPLHPMATD